MAPVEEVSFELERFEWTADDRLVVVGRWNGVRGRRISRPVLTVDAGGRRRRVSGSQEADGEAWRASFPWDGGLGDIAGAELEIGRNLVVELPPPRRRRRRAAPSASEDDLRAQVEELRSMVVDLRAERVALRADAAEAERLTGEIEALRSAGAGDEELAAARDEIARLSAELEALRGEEAPADQELAGLRLAHGSLKAAHERLEDELEALRAVRDERDELAGQLQQLRAGAGDEERERAALGELIRELQERASASDAANERLTNELAVAREDVTRLQGLLAEHEEALTSAHADTERRVESERATTTEVHARLATAREEAQRSMVAEAEETERLRRELARTRDESERLLAAERSEVARLREELLTSEPLEDSDSEESARRMLERVTRDLERERAASRTLRRELDAARSDSADQRRAVSSATANGTLAMDEPPVPATAAGRAGRAVRTPEGTQRRVEAARAAASQRVPRVPPSQVSLWAVRIGAALLVALLGVILVVLVSMVT